MVFGVEIDEAPALADFAAHHRLEALREQPREIGVVILGPIGDVLQAGVPRAAGSRDTSTARRCGVWISSTCSGPELASATELCGS